MTGSRQYTKLTGRVCFRTSLTRRLVLRVEYAFMTANSSGPRIGQSYPVFEWRDACAADLADLVAMRVLPADQVERPRKFECEASAPSNERTVIA